VPNRRTRLAEIAGQLERRLEGAPEEEVARIEQALDDLKELEEIIRCRSVGSQGRLDALARRYEREPLPKKGGRATPLARLKRLTMELVAHGSRWTLCERKRDGK
jgi:hypothetical protein